MNIRSLFTIASLPSAALGRLRSHPLELGLVQAGVVSLLALSVALLGRWRALNLTQETIVALVRGLVQMIAVGLVLVWMLKGSVWWGVLALICMFVVAASVAKRRVTHIPGAFEICLRSITIGSTVVIAAMTLSGVIQWKISSLVPLSSMLIAAAMNTSAQVLERFGSDAIANRGKIEAALSLGASGAAAVHSYVRDAVLASLMPSINSLRSLGIVWIPGFAAGMLLAGSDPLYTSVYQFVVIAMIYATSGLTALSTASLMQRRAFSGAEQFVLLKRQ